MRVLICGGRNFNDVNLFTESMEKIKHDYRFDDKTVIVTGGARGADTMGHNWGKAAGYITEVYAADWNQFGESAGPIRNAQMLSTGIDLVVAFPGGSGTDDLTYQAHMANVPVLNVWSKT